MTKLTKHPGYWLLAALLLLSLSAGCGGRKKNDTSTLYGTAEPDKVLFDRAMEDIKKNRHTVARLTLQTLINTYPDSEYLAKAKLAIADSHYEEGGTSGLTQAVAEYKDFITFFPFLDEAAYAQYRVGMAHYRRMEKPDRDTTQARLAEVEFQTFLLKHPDHELAAEAEQRLREVQEVRAEGEFRVARYYYIKGSLRAAGARLLELVERYPLYSQADNALWMLGDSYERVERGDVAATFYSRIVREYPFSARAEEAKRKLERLGVPVPQPNPDALARFQREREFAREKPGMLRKSLGLFKSGPDVSMAARTGKPNMTPPSETVSSGQVLAGGSPGSSIVVETAPSGGAAAAAPSSGAAAKPDAPGAEPPKASPELPARAEPKSAAKKSEEEKKAEEKKKEEERKAEEKKKKEPKKPSEKKGFRKLIPW